MGLITIVIIAVALAMDAFAVSIVTSSVYKQLRIKHAFRMALFFGSFQAFMPLFGSLTGMSVKQYLANYDHWIAFVLLSAVGIKMIYESSKIAPDKEFFNPSKISVLLILSVATSIDAFVIGITLLFLEVSITTAAVIIGLVTFVLSYLGAFIGKKIGHFFESKIEAVGGLLLTALGLKILLEHLFL